MLIKARSVIVDACLDHKAHTEIVAVVFGALQHTFAAERACFEVIDSRFLAVFNREFRYYDPEGLE